MLKSLELFGFKSFADRTQFDFDAGVTCVVGPNGSGKSNVVDAIKWILGDQSAKSLRGKDMLDVVFNGSAGRKPSGFAEATLTFDNSQGLFPTDAIEVQIGRRLYRSGDSEYLLNRNVVRLKDIKDLFMGTGAGTAAYSIIEQGRVDQILQANPTTRRLVFEEAAGISKYKSRKVEAERRLERVEQNLVRLRDIVVTAEAQLTATRSQAGKATKFRELSTELEQLWTGLAADDFRHFQSQLSTREAEVAELAATLEALTNALAQVDAEKRATEAELGQIEDKVLGFERKSAVEREAIASLDSTVRHQTVRCEELSHEIARNRDQRREVLLALSMAESELQRSEEQLSRLQLEFDQSHAAVARRESEFSTLRDQITQRRANLNLRRKETGQTQQRRNSTQERLVALRSQRDGLVQSEVDAQDKLEQARDLLQKANAERQQRQQALTEAEGASRHAQGLVDRLQIDRSSLAGQQSEAEKRLTDLRERRSAVLARLKVLEELEQRQEGIAIGVREILRRAETTHYPPWNSVLGLVRDLIDVPLEWAPVVEVALGDRAQLIAVKRLQPLLTYLNRGPALIEGRVGFIALQPDPDGQTESATDEPEFDVASAEGVVARADRVISEVDRVGGLAARVLGDTWIVDSLDAARALLPHTKSRCRFVTLQGELISAEGVLHVGTMPHESSIISRKSELRQLRNEVHQLDRGIEACLERREILHESLNTHADQLDDAAEILRQKTLLVTECATQLTGQDREVQRLEKAYGDQIRSVESLFARREELERQIVEKERELAAIDADLESFSTVITAEEQDLVEVEALLQEAQNIIRSEQLSLAKHEERLRGLTETQRRLSEEQVSRERQSQELATQWNRARQNRDRAELQILNAQSAAAIRILEVEKIAGESRGLQFSRDALRQRRSTITRQDEELQQQRRKLAETRHAIEMELRDIQHQVKVLAERIQEEYQTSLETLAERGLSAYEIYRQRLQSELVADGADDISLDEQNAALPSYAEARVEMEAEVDKLRRRLKALGHVNTESLETLEAVEARYTHLASQLQDLEEAKWALESIIKRINAESQRIFIETFETIRGHFIELFRKLFGGGDADIILEDLNDVLECGIDIVARPPGKELRSISLLSGGEKTMTAVALLFAMFKSKPSPYCVLDEVDAALDEANVDRYARVLKEFVEMTQFVVITHRKRTMTAANVLYGVTMEQAGVSKRMSVRFEDVGEHGEINSRSAA